MKTQELRKLIREEIKKTIKEENGEANKYIKKITPGDLKLGEYYQIYDPGMDEFHDEYEYLGFDTNSREYMFRAFDAPGGYFHFIGVTQNDLSSDVAPSKF